MGVKKYKTHYDEFELDLTPLLAIIMKLVPVLIITSSFLQLTQIDTDLPQVVKEAIKNQDKEIEKPIHIMVALDAKNNINIAVNNAGNVQGISIPAKNSVIDFNLLNDKFVEIKKMYPHIFKIEFAPSESIAYSEIVKVMDEARKARENIEFSFKDTKTGNDVKTDYMFPEVVFANVFN
ncbi:MAG: biopolymer transporter ExbD [Bdellovibrionales bacterium]|nr:biopolymer transporter ExbD [Bdellovibrionales bacterium]